MKNRPLVAEGLSPLLLLRKNENGEDIAFSVATAIPSHASELASIDHAWGQGGGLRKHLSNEKKGNTKSHPNVRLGGASLALLAGKITWCLVRV